ncbi:type VI secretion system baseplate subunit TssG [Atlantibacter sp.]|uniref:type VI secretion system baseplate subunit TssG n=1 Tax=Atlantibacter sp. TaxID=1903473 RepID=UPI0028AB23F0|nr:type VI secretion system baseplate subunit TssG [Atlantibacter sp.]
MIENTTPLKNATSLLAAWYRAGHPWESGFISIMRAIGARTPMLPAPGKALRPTHEIFRLGQAAHMAFSPREIAQITAEDDKLKIQLFSLGIWGAQGAMPLHLTEQAFSRSELHDHTLTDFVDIFHHRAITQLYRAWLVAQDTASLDRKDDERFSFYIGSLIGIDPQELDGVTLPVHARLASAAHLIRESRNPEGVVGALRYYFDIAVNIEEYARQWIFLTKSDQSMLGNADSAMLLGDGAILGDTVQDRQHKFRLLLGPLTLRQYMQFSPWGKDLPVLREWIRNFIGFEYAWDVQLVLAAEEVPQAQLNGAHQLGYATWLEREDTTTPVSGMSFEPETWQS